MAKVTVIMPCFNHARFVTESIRAIQQQTHLDIELLVVDDASSDHSLEIVHSLARDDSRIRSIKHSQNQGASKSRNDGLRAASGSFIAFCDADDVWERDKLAFQLNLLQSNPEFDVAYSDSALVDENGLSTGGRFSDLFPPPQSVSGYLFRELILRNFINIQSVLMRRQCFERVGTFDEHIKWVEDWWYWVRLSQHHRFLYSQEPLARYRLHSGAPISFKGVAIALIDLRSLGEYFGLVPDLSSLLRAAILYRMGIDLCKIGRARAGRRLFWKAMRLATSNHACPTWVGERWLVWSFYRDNYPRVLIKKPGVFHSFSRRPADEPEAQCRPYASSRSLCALRQITNTRREMLFGRQSFSRC